MRAKRGFTLLELLVTIGIVAVIAVILFPAIGAVVKAGRVTKCLSNLRTLQMAHVLYMNDHEQRFVSVGLAHGGRTEEDYAWVNTLREYFGGDEYESVEQQERSRGENWRYGRHDAVLRSPLDTSPHWPRTEGGEGVPVPGTSDAYRRTSYGINNFLTTKTPWFDYERPRQSLPDRLTRVDSPAATVHFLMMAFEGPFAGSDHTHVEQWHGGPQSAPERAAVHVQINAVRGRIDGTGEANYGFLDGHVETAEFSEVYQDEAWNRFDPLHSRTWAARTVHGGG